MDRLIVNFDSLRLASRRAQSVAGKLRDLSGEATWLCLTFGAVHAKYIGQVGDYARKLRKTAEAAESLGRAIGQAAERFESTEHELRGDQQSKWDEHPFDYLDNILDMLGIGKYDRDYRDPGKEAEREADAMMSNEIYQELHSEYMNEDLWNKATLEERKEMINNFVRELNLIYGTNITKNVNFYYEEPEDGMISRGYYTDSKRRVSINTYCIENNSYERVMTTVIHEMRHAYQHEAVRHPERYTVSEETVRGWEKNFRNYVDPDDNYDAYKSQPVEADANGFSQSDAIWNPQAANEQIEIHWPDIHIDSWRLQ